MERLLNKESYEDIQTSRKRTIAVLGGTGHVGSIYIEEFLCTGFNVRILARSP